MDAKRICETCRLPFEPALPEDVNHYFKSQCISALGNVLERLEGELIKSYNLCNDGAATPSNILLYVLNALAEARRIQ